LDFDFSILRQSRLFSLDINGFLGIGNLKMLNLTQGVKFSIFALKKSNEKYLHTKLYSKIH